ncbi:MAG: formate--tetrahydrofolate ligase [Candidatus Omnitrophota bacterium]
MLSDLEIAQRAEIKPVAEIAERIGLLPDELEFHGKYKAKIDLQVMDRVKSRPPGKYIDVTAITPTPLGEGKTVTTIGLSQALAKIGKNVLTCIRQPSLGPVFGIKGGAAGGGYSQVIPMEDFNLHLTGDVHAVGLAHNLLAAFIDNSLFQKNPLNINPYTITWPRVLDVSDRALRKIVIGLGGKEDGVPRESSFDITVASEVMAILALTTDLFDLRKRLGKIVVATDRNGKAITAEDLKAAGAMAVLLKDAIKPTLMQTLEHTPCFVHAGPFANIAHGNSSVIADLIGVRMAEYVVTESGFGADCGAEKFFDIKCRVSGLKPDAVVIVGSVRALKMHSGKFKIVPGRPLSEKLLKEDPDTVIEGAANLAKHIENVKLYGVPIVVAINRFPTDFDSEIKAVYKVAREAGAEAACESNVWAKGGEGGRELAEAVVSAAGKPKDFKFLYPLEASIKEKIEAVGTKIYGAARVEYSPLAEEKIARYTELGYANLPVCMAKTHLSLSHDPKLKGRPTGFTLPIRDIRLAAGAGFLYPLCGEMRTMPGLPSEPAGTKIDIDKNGAVVGLF